MEIANELHFPNYFPNDCPPNDARSEELSLFRLCVSNPPTTNDFLSYYQIDPDKYNGVIDAYGLSTFKAVEDCHKALSISPSLRKNCSYIASVVSYYRTGVIKHTPSKSFSSHHTWWLFEGVHAEDCVTECFGVGEGR
jgi:hypothetical protein